MRTAQSLECKHAELDQSTAWGNTGYLPSKYHRLDPPSPASPNPGQAETAATKSQPENPKPTTSIPPDQLIQLARELRRVSNLKSQI